MQEMQIVPSFLVNIFSVIAIVLPLLFLAVLVLKFLKHNKSKESAQAKSSSDVDAKASDPESESKQLDNLIIAIQRQASLSGLHLKTSINMLIDKLVNVKEALETVDRSDKALLHTVPNDFKRLLSKHLPELMSKYSAVEENEESKQAFEASLSQLGDEMNAIVETINERNFADFANKDKFVKLRYSNQF